MRKYHYIIYNLRLFILFIVLFKGFFIFQDTLLIRYDSHQLEVGTGEVASGTLKKTIK